MYPMGLKGLYLCVVRTNIKGFVCDVNIQGYVYVMRIFKEALGVYVCAEWPKRCLCDMNDQSCVM